MERKLALLVEYQGTRYHGFQIQNNADTVQARLEAAVQQLVGVPVRVKGASRTDTGVHALGQVACYTAASGHSPETVRNALNYYLPEDIVVKEVREVGLDVDPRRNATSRWYRYSILHRATPSPLTRHVSALVKDGLDLDTMGDAAATLAGIHDLASFSGPLAEAEASTVRSVLHAGVTQKGDYIFFDMEANAFLPQQMRRTVAVLLAIGRGQAPASRVKELLERPVLGTADQLAPAHGLCLMRIEYPEHKIAFTASTEGGYDTKLPAFAGR